MLTGAATGAGSGFGRDPADVAAARPKKHTTERDPAPENLRQRLRERGVSLAAASLAIGRNRAWLQQYLSRGIPRALSYRDSAALAALLDCDPSLLRHAEIPPRKPRKRAQRKRPSATSGLAAVPEIEIEPSAAPDARGEELEREKARWRLPEAMIRRAVGADPASLRIVGVRGNAMEPLLREGDRLVVDTAKRDPSAGGLFVLREPGGFAVWRVEPVGGTDPPRLRLNCANPDYEARTRLAGNVQIVGEVIWTMTRE